MEKRRRERTAVHGSRVSNRQWRENGKDAKVIKEKVMKRKTRNGRKKEAMKGENR